MKNKGELLQILTNIYKRTHRSGSASWMVRWKSPISGRWVAVTGGRTKGEALILESQVRQELLKGNDPTFLKTEAEPELLVNRVIDLFCNHSRFLSGSEGWRVENRARLEQWIRPALGTVRFADLTQDRILKFYISMRDEGLGRPTICKAHTLMCLLGDCFTELRPEHENIPRKIRNFGKYFPKRAPKREINFLMPEELETLYHKAFVSQNKLLLPLICFLANTGMRRSEALNLQWTDIDRKTGFIYIRKSKNGKARAIPLEAEAWEAIEGLQKKRSKFVFVDKEGSRPHEDSFLKPLRTAAKRAGITKRIDLHTMRHSYGSNKIRMGWGLKKVSMLLGHSDISVTANIYTHLLDGDLRVRDDFRFDNKGVKENSRELVGVHEMASQLIADALVRALKSENSSTIERVEQELAAIIKGELTAKKNPAKAEISQDLVSSEEIMQYSEETQNGGLDATLLLRDRFRCLIEDETMGKGVGKFQYDFGKLGLTLGNRGDVIRTRDLFVPNEAR